MDYRRFSFFGLVAIVFLWGPTSFLLAQDSGDSVPNILPSTTALYVEIEHPDALLEEILAHPLTSSLLESEQFQELLTSTQMGQAMLAKAFIEAKLGEPIVEAFKTNTAGGLWFAMDTETNGALLILKSRDQAKLRRVAGTILNLVAENSKGDDEPYKKKTYRKAVTAKFDNGVILARYEDWFFVTNKGKLAKAVLDNLIDGTSDCLANQAWFKESLVSKADSDIWAAVDLATIRRSGIAKELFTGKTDNPGVELVLGGILDALRHAPVADASVNLDEHLDISVSVPFSNEWASEARAFFFGEKLNGTAPVAFEPKGMIASLTSYRDLGAWWLAKEDLFDENVIAQLAQADSQLSTIFSGMDFGEEVLGSLQPGIQIVVTENGYDEKYSPDLKLPAFAMIGKLKDAPKIQRRFKVAFQSVIGFANINLGMQGQPQLDLETEKRGTAKISSASYLFDDETEDGLLMFNFSPTLAFQKDYVIFSSTRDLAVELTDLMDAPGSNQDSNTSLQIRGEALSRILNDNRESMIAQNMLEKGHTRKEAEGEIGTLLTLVKLFRAGKIDYRIHDDRMELSTRLSFEPPKRQRSK